MTAEKNGKAKGEAMRKRGKKAAAAERSGAATTATDTAGEVSEAWAELVGEVRKVVAIWEGMAKSLETIAARVESVRRTLWRLEEVRGYVAKGDAKAAGEAAAEPGTEPGAAARGGYVPTIHPLPPEEDGTRKGVKSTVTDLAAIPDGGALEGGEA